jgi:hypothetical protein
LLDENGFAVVARLRTGPAAATPSGSRNSGRQVLAGHTALPGTIRLILTTRF